MTQQMSLNTTEGPISDIETQTQEAAEVTTEDAKLQMYAVSFSVGWLPGSISLTDQAKTAISSSRGSDKRSIRGSYAILGASRDNLIKEGATLKRMLTVIRDQYTIPEYTLRSVAYSGEDRHEKVKGRYLIEAVKIDEFLTRFDDIRQQYLDWGKRVAEDQNYSRIREADKIALGLDWDVVSNRYPTAGSLGDCISCDVPKIEPFNADISIEDIAPATAERLKQQTKDRLEASISGATAELVCEFRRMLEAITRNCGKRVRLFPTSADKQKYRAAEVTNIIRHENDSDVPEDHVMVTLQFVTQSSTDPSKFHNMGTAKQELLTVEDYKSLHPTDTDEYRKLAKSSFENLSWMAEKIDSVKGMLSSDEESQPLLSLAGEVQRELGELGGSVSSITNALKANNFARSQAKSMFQGFLDKAKVQETKLKQAGRSRRRVTVNKNEKVDGDSD